MITIPQWLEDEMWAWSFHCQPEEACGLIGGVDQKAVVFVPVENIFHSGRDFMLCPIEHLAGMNYLEDHGHELLAVFHSHPTGDAYPSRADRSAAQHHPGIYWFIAALRTREFKGFRIDGVEVSELI